MHFGAVFADFEGKNRKNYITVYQMIMEIYMLKNIVLLHIFKL